MLHRASKHTSKLDAYRYWQKSFDALYLPWLCPSLYGSASSRPRKTSTIASARLSPHPTPCRSTLFKTNVHGSKKGRGLASAVGADYVTSQDHYIPFEASGKTPYADADLGRGWLRPITSPLPPVASVTPTFDPDSALIIHESLIAQPQRFRAVNAISGEVVEILQTLRACVQVDRLERAATLMRRLNEIYKPNALELVKAHNDYLRELVQKLRHSKDPRILKRIHKWFEVDLRGIGVVPDATTYALMIQAALQESSYKKVDRTVRRYMFLADEAGVRHNVMQVLLLMFSEQDIGRITEIAPTQSILTTPPVAQPGEPLEDSNAAALDPSTEFSEIPEIQSTPTKGLGMAALKQALSILSQQRSPQASKTDISVEAETYQTHAFKRQQQIEMNTYESAIERWRTETKKLMGLGINLALKNGPISGLLWTWHEALIARIKEEICQANLAESAKIRKPMDTERCLYGPFLQILPVEKLSAITILNIMNFLCIKGPGHVGLPLTSIVKNLGRAVADESFAEIIRKDGDHKLWHSPETPQRVQKISNMVERRRMDSTYGKLLEQEIPSEERRKGLKWADPIKIKVGAVLVSLLVQVAKIGVTSKDPASGAEIRESQPAFIHSGTYQKGKRIGVLRFNKAMAAKLGEEPVSCALAKYLPMVVEPKPWVGYRNGAFLHHVGRAVRNHAGDIHSRRYAKTASENGDMDIVFSSLDVLARTPWRINRDLFEVMVAGWNSGEHLGHIPPAQPDLTEPAEPPAEAGERARMNWCYRMKDLENKRAGFHSRRCFLNFQLEVARAYLDEVFYFPHNVDFRGRAYPMVPFLNHMGADPARSLLVFAKGKELGEKGLRWMKIHLASLYGLTKATFEKREKFTEDNLSNIFDSANRPLDGKRWWLQAEEPWQCLGACIELKRALESPDPRQFISRLPIHQDGTCNGLQHYAALGGDTLGAKQVNLEPSEKPQDVYSAVANMVRDEIVAEAVQGNELAKLLQHNITRKVVKQTVMTNVYGVTFMGAIMQVRRQIAESGIAFPDDKTKFGAGPYIAVKIFKALSTMFYGAHQIQHWLSDCAGRISRAVTPEQILNLRQPPHNRKAADSPLAKVALTGKNCRSGTRENDLFRSVVIWTTPLKMPVVQPYRAGIVQKVNTNLQKISIVSPTKTDPCHRRRQLQAFPPNFIHSLDASHMMLTALKCNEMGLTFASVHDSFWTHAADVDVLNEILREAFVRMHSEDIIGRLRSEFMLRYKGSLRLLKIPRKSAAGEKILQWRKKNGHTKSKSQKVEELLLEDRRLELLGSDKPEDRLEGESMVTAGKIYSDEVKDNDAAIIDDTDIKNDGKIPTDSQIEGDEICLLGPVGPLANDDNFEINETEENEVVEAPPEPAKTKSKSNVWVWVPITFPPTPKKGDFDVSKVNQSKYFFC